MPLKMSKQSRFELLNGARQVYASKRTRKDKHDFLLEMQQLTGYKSTKTIIRALSSTKEKPVKEKRGRNHFLKTREIKILKKLWFAMDQPCGKRLKAMLPEWIDAWENRLSLPIDTSYLKPVSQRWIEFSNLTKHRHPELSSMERSPR